MQIDRWRVGCHSAEKRHAHLLPGLDGGEEPERGGHDEVTTRFVRVFIKVSVYGFYSRSQSSAVEG